MSMSMPAHEMSDSMAETRRRQKATVTGGESTLDDASGYVRDFQTDDQKFVLWNMANADLRPKSLKPAFRILGLFPDQESMMEHAQLVAASDQTASIFGATTHEWYTIVKSSERASEGQAKVNRNLLLHQNMLQDNASEFKRRHDALTAGRTPAIEQAKGAAEQVEREDRLREQRKKIVAAAVEKDEGEVERLKADYEKEAVSVAEREVAKVIREGEKEDDGEEEGKVEEVDEEYVETPLVAPVDPESLNKDWESRAKELEGVHKPRSVARHLEVRNQKYAVVSVVKDYETAGEGDPVGEEPGVIVWAAFDTEEEAIKYNKNIASKQLRDHDIAIVSMYEWLYPHMMNSDKVDQLYRNEELNNIMKHARTSSTRVREFEAMCEREDIECPSMSIEPDLTEPAPRVYKPPVGSDLEGGLECAEMCIEPDLDTAVPRKTDAPVGSDV